MNKDIKGTKRYSIPPGLNIEDILKDEDQNDDAHSVVILDDSSVRFTDDSTIADSNYKFVYGIAIPGVIHVTGIKQKSEFLSILKKCTEDCGANERYLLVHNRHSKVQKALYVCSIVLPTKALGVTFNKRRDCQYVYVSSVPELSPMLHLLHKGEYIQSLYIPESNADDGKVIAEETEKGEDLDPETLVKYLQETRNIEGRVMTLTNSKKKVKYDHEIGEMIIEEATTILSIFICCPCIMLFCPCLIGDGED